MKSLREDMARRDFTMNALAVKLCSSNNSSGSGKPCGEIIDFFGGLDDIEKKLIRCVGEPSDRFSEDGLRILRALRFASVLGFEVEENTKEAIHNQKEILNSISQERLYEESTKLLCGKNVGRVLREYADVLAVFIPEIEPMPGFDQKNKHHIFDLWEHTIRTIENVPADHVLRWAALFHDIGKPRTFTFGKDGQGHFYGHAAVSVELAKAVMKRLRFSSADMSEVAKLIRYHDTPLTPERKRIKRMLAKLGADSFYKLIALAKADNMAQAPEYRYRQKTYAETEALTDEIIRDEECFSLKDLAISGHDLVEAGYAGSKIGEILRALLADVLDGTLENDRKMLLQRIKVKKEQE